MVKVFYHNDADGRCSAFWVRKYLESSGIKFEASDFIEMNYDMNFSMQGVYIGEQIFMVDFSLDPQTMYEIDSNFDFIWIDHHKTAIDKMEGCTISGIRQDGVAACLLTWAYINKRPITVNAPLFTQYIHLWDTWQWKNHPDKDKIEAFVTGLQIRDIHPCSSEWDMLNDNEILAPECNDSSEGELQMRGIINKGRDMITFRNGYASDLCNSIGKVIEFEGVRCFACNMAHVSSEWFKSVDPSTYDVLMPFYYNMNTGMFNVSLYGKGDIDVSKIAVKHKGGGHFSASGFQCKELPWMV